MLQVIAAILSLLLLAGVFGSSMEADDDTQVKSGEHAGGEHDETRVGGMP